mmetsp:Transcript_4066/g.9660  ORF Transcript_4066/g.9660 Transcript_4066/m.9660 type:complete len:253 (-) Transcript_4066:1954-2712(-)
MHHVVLPLFHQFDSIRVFRSTFTWVRLCPIEVEGWCVAFQILDLGSLLDSRCDENTNANPGDHIRCRRNLVGQGSNFLSDRQALTILEHFRGSTVEPCDFEIEQVFAVVRSDVLVRNVYVIKVAPTTRVDPQVSARTISALVHAFAVKISDAEPVALDHSKPTRCPTVHPATPTTCICNAILLVIAILHAFVPHAVHELATTALALARFCAPTERRSQWVFIDARAVELATIPQDILNGTFEDSIRKSVMDL